MFGWLRWVRAPPTVLTGAPAVRRQKTYSAGSGYVYQYFYQGHRVAAYQGAAATEYVFDVSADRKSSFPVSVYLPEDAAGAWEQAHRRTLNSTERYAIAKMALFSAFDTRENPGELRESIVVSSGAVSELLDALSID